MRVRARLTAAAGMLRIPTMVLALYRQRIPTFLTVVNYHRVDLPSSAADTDEGTLDATPASFERQLGLLTRHMTPIGMPDLRAYLEGRGLPANPVLVTFDDGYRDNLTNALPLLVRHGIRATFFITTGYLGRRQLFWWDRVCWIVKHARRRRFAVEGAPEPLEVDLDAGAKNAARQLLGIVKTRQGLDLDPFLDRLARAADAPWSREVEAALVERLVMTWDDVRALRRAGMDVGSHTRTHRMLQSLPAEQLADELAGSRADLEAQLGEPVDAIAYPVGRRVAHVSRLRSAVEGAGYRLGFTYGTGRQPLRSLDPLDVHRFSVERDDTDEALLGRLALPCLAPRRSHP